MPEAESSSEAITDVILKHIEQDEVRIAKNFKIDLIIVTTDKVRLYLKDFKESVESVIGIRFPLGIAIGLVTALLTATFKETFGVPGEWWRALYCLAVFCCVIWIVLASIGAYRKKQMRDINRGIEHLKGNVQ